MYVNRTYSSVVDQYKKSDRSNRTQLKSESRIMPSEAVLDLIADQKLSGGYNRRNKLCTECNQKKSVSGSCFCTE